MARSPLLRPKALDDIRRTVGWLRQNVSGTAAARWQSAVANAVGSLLIRPERCTEADEAADVGFDLRCHLFGRRPHVYRILFTYDANEVTVYRVRHAAQDAVSDDDL